LDINILKIGGNFFTPISQINMNNSNPYLRENAIQIFKTIAAAHGEKVFR